MNILIVNHSLYHGGVETLIVRMANWLVAHGHSCAILLRDVFEGDLCSCLDQRVIVRCVGNRWDLLAVPGIKHLVWRSFAIPKPDFIYSLEQNWNFVGLLFADYFRNDANPPKVATGAYHINQFAYEGEPVRVSYLSRFLRETYNHLYHDSQKFFMSEEVKQGHEAFFKREIKEGWVWPLPIEVDQAAKSFKRNPIPFRIVSIGRLTKFKSYSWYMVPIIQRLRLKYPQVQWHIYGKGMCQEELVSTTWKEGIEEGYIFHHGAIHYSELPKVFEQADVFIGMGTACLEAAAHGVPVIPALADDWDAVTWGFAYDMPYFTVGEWVPENKPAKQVEELLLEFFKFSDKERWSCEQKTLQYMDRYSMDRVMQDLIQHIYSLLRPSKLQFQSMFKFLAVRLKRNIKNLLNGIVYWGREKPRTPGGSRFYY